MISKTNQLELEDHADKILKRLGPIEKERNTLINEYKKTYFKIFDNCDHFIVVSYEQYDSYEGRHYYSYGCIKCGLDQMAQTYYGEFYDKEYSVMHEYFENGQRLKGYKPKVEFNFSGYSTTGGFEIGKKLCRNVLMNEPFISNKELDEKLIEEVKKFKKRNKCKSRKRV